MKECKYTACEFLPHPGVTKSFSHFIFSSGERHGVGEAKCWPFQHQETCEVQGGLRRVGGLDWNILSDVFYPIGLHQLLAYSKFEIHSGIHCGLTWLLRAERKLPSKLEAMFTFTFFSHMCVVSGVFRCRISEMQESPLHSCMIASFLCITSNKLTPRILPTGHYAPVCVCFSSSVYCILLSPCSEGIIY